MGGEGPSQPPAELMARRKVTNVRERQRKRVPAIPEQASASRKRPEEEEEEDSVQSNKSGPALLALRMRRGLGARVEVPGFGTHADYGEGGKYGEAENGACAWFLWAGLVVE